MEKVKISTEFIKLDSFLKWASVVSSGADAKIFIFEGKVKVNDEVEVRRGKKLKPGDKIEVDNKLFYIE